MSVLFCLFTYPSLIKFLACEVIHAAVCPLCQQEMKVWTASHLRKPETNSLYQEGTPLGEALLRHLKTVHRKTDELGECQCYVRP